MMESVRRSVAEAATSPNRLAVLLVAENASMLKGGEPSLPAHWFRELLKEGVDVHLLVHARSRPELKQSFIQFSSRIHYVPEVLLQTIFWKLGEKATRPREDLYHRLAGAPGHAIHATPRGPAPDRTV